MNSRLNVTEEQISDLENRIMKTTLSEQQTERQMEKKKRRRKQHMRSTDEYKACQPTHLHIIGVPESKEREKETKNVFVEIMAEDFPNLTKKNRYPGTGNKDSSKQDEPE